MSSRLREMLGMRMEMTEEEEEEEAEEEEEEGISDEEIDPHQASARFQVHLVLSWPGTRCVVSPAGVSGGAAEDSIDYLLPLTYSGDTMGWQKAREAPNLLRSSVRAREREGRRRRRKENAAKGKDRKCREGRKRHRDSKEEVATSSGQESPTPPPPHQKSAHGIVGSRTWRGSTTRTCKSLGFAHHTYRSVSALAPLLSSPPHQCSP
eukprot:286256-Hanusia_phi.AAC.2